MIRRLPIPIDSLDVAAVIGLALITVGVLASFGLGPALIVLGVALVAIVLVIAFSQSSAQEG